MPDPESIPDCVFCGIVAGAEKSHLLYEDEQTVAFLDTAPIERGHSLIVPRRHYERITDMDSGEVGSLFSKVPRLARAVVAATGADAFTLAQNNGEAARQTVPHVHIHIIPRYAGREASWGRHGSREESELASVADKIRTYLRNHFE